MNRKKFVRTGFITFSGAVTAPAFGVGILQKESERIDPERIKEFVVAGHGDLKTLKQMLSEEPNLIYSRHDWGGGDFEEAIEGAGHVGDQDIASYLIDHGARANLFVLTMLGKDKIVIPALEEYPALLNAKGPHGFSLLHHAKVGGAGSEIIFDYLVGRGMVQMQYRI